MQRTTADRKGMKTLVHPELDELELHLLDRLAHSKSNDIEDHLLLCNNCRVMSSALEREIKMIRGALSQS